jgi:di/tricarboxylate transporter
LAAGRDLLEVIPAPHSTILGRSIRDLQFRTKYGLNVIAFWHRGTAFRTEFADFPIQNSDALLVYGPRQNYRLLENDPDWLVLRLGESTSIRRNKMDLALLILALTLVMTIFSPFPIYLVMFIGAIAMILTRCLRMEEAYQSIDWRSLFLVGGMLPVGVALTKTGAAALLGNQIIAIFGGLGPLAVAGGLFIATSILNQFIPGGSAVPAILVPIAIAAAKQVGADPRAFALVVAIASGTAMLTPFAHPVNVLVMGPGGYHFKDYLKAGAPVALIVFIVVMLVLPIFWKI